MKTLLKNNYELLLFFFLVLLFIIMAYYRVGQLNGDPKYNLNNHRIIVNQ